MTAEVPRREIDRRRIDALNLRKDLNKLKEALSTADENGLFPKSDTEPETKDKNETENKIYYEEIFDEVYNGFTFLDSEPPNITEARKSYDKAYHQFHRAIDATDRWWRFKYLFGGWFFIYLLGFFAGVLFLWFSYSSIITSSTILWVPSWAYLWGLMGGILQGVWTLWHNLEDQNLRRHLMVWFFILPFLGAILGAIAYLIFYAGFIVATGAGQIETEAFVMLLSVLAGFSSKWAVMLLLRIAKLVQPQTE